MSALGPSGALVVSCYYLFVLRNYIIKQLLTHDVISTENTSIASGLPYVNIGILRST